jgi:hypothetical protein
LLENNEGVIKNEQSRETGNMGYTKQNTMTNKTKNTTQSVSVECPTAIQTTTKQTQAHTTSIQLQGNCGALLRKLHNAESEKSSRLSGGKGKYVNKVSNNMRAKLQSNSRCSLRDLKS